MSGVLLGLVALRIETSFPQIVDRWVKYGKNSPMRPQTVGKCRTNVWEDSLKEHVLSLSQEAVEIVWHAVRRPTVDVRMQWSHVFSIAVSVNYTD
jgi:hypothetical protein